MLSYTLKRHERIRKRSEYITIYTQGVTRESRHFRITILPNAFQWSRLGLTVSKKIGNAVQRNLVKRRLREYFRLHKAYLPRSHDIVFTAKQGAPKVSSTALTRELDTVLCPDALQPENSKVLNQH